MKGRVALVSGASSGIGHAASRQMAALGAHVVLLARDRARGEAAIETICGGGSTGTCELLLADFARLHTVIEASAALQSKHERLDVLVNNAGAIYQQRTVTFDGHEATWQVNHLAHHLLTRLLHPVLASTPGARVITVSSDSHFAAWRGLRFDDIEMERDWSPFGAYAASKLANIMFCYEHARRAADDGIVSNVMHPGLVRSGFGREGYGPFGRFIDAVSPVIAKTPEQGADTITWLASSAEGGQATGTYFFKRRPHRSSRPSRSIPDQRHLWDLAEEQLAGLLPR